MAMLKKITHTPNPLALESEGVQVFYRTPMKAET